MSRRPGTRTRTSAPAKATKSKKAAATNGTGAGRVGERTFKRRARSTQRSRVVQRKRPTRPGLGTRLLSIPYGDLVRRVPRVAWICALVGCLNAIGWSILTPPFQVPDEPDHFAYVKQLAETGSLPRSNGRETSSAEEVSTLVAIHYFNVRQQPQHHTIASRAEQHTLESELASLRRDQGSTEAGVAVSQPPLYYALEAIPYSLAHSGTVLDRLQLMRLLSALFAGLTAMFVFLFIRETLPGTPWAWTVGGLSVALAPLLGFMSGAVNPDSMLAAVSAAIFYCLARAFRRGLTTRSAATIGLVSAIGLLTKLNFVGLLPGVLLGLLVLSVRAARVSGRSAYLLLALGAGIAFSPAVLYAAINGLSHHPVLGIVSATINTTHSSMLAELNYIWQFYLPRLPGTVNDFPGLFTTRQLWFNDYVGLYGWLDTTFPSWVDNLALIPAGALVLLCGGSLIRERDALRGRWAEVAVYAVIAVGLLMLIGADSYRTFPRSDAEFAQPRYLLPLLALLGAALALAARGAGRRWGPVAGALIVVLFLAHDIFSQLLTAGRFYG